MAGRRRGALHSLADAEIVGSGYCESERCMCCASSSFCGGGYFGSRFEAAAGTVFWLWTALGGDSPTFWRFVVWGCLPCSEAEDRYSCSLSPLFSRLKSGRGLWFLRDLNDAGFVAPSA